MGGETHSLKYCFYRIKFHFINGYLRKKFGWGRNTRGCDAPGLTSGGLDAQTLRVPDRLLLLNVKLDQIVGEEELERKKKKCISAKEFCF